MVILKEIRELMDVMMHPSAKITAKSTGAALKFYYAISAIPLAISLLLLLVASLLFGSMLGSFGSVLAFILVLLFFLVLSPLWVLLCALIIQLMGFNLFNEFKGKYSDTLSALIYGASVPILFFFIPLFIILVGSLAATLSGSLALAIVVLGIIISVVLGFWSFIMMLIGIASLNKTSRVSAFVIMEASGSILALVVYAAAISLAFMFGLGVFNGASLLGNTALSPGLSGAYVPTSVQTSIPYSGASSVTTTYLPTSATTTVLATTNTVANGMIVQSACTSSESAGPLSLSFMSNVKAGDMLVVAAGAGNYWGSVITSPPKDSQGNAWTTLEQSSDSFGRSASAIWYATVKSPGMEIIAVNFSSIRNGMCVYELSGVSYLSGAQSNSTSSEYSQVSELLYQKGAFLIAVAGSYQSGSVLGTPGFTTDESSPNYYLIEHNLASSAGSNYFPMRWNASPNEYYAESAAVFDPS
jgi:hypothetical protein